MKAIVIASISTSIFSSVCFISPASTAAGLDFIHNPKASIRAKISETAPTRINFGGYQITEVIGDENKYKIITDSAGLNVFITPKVASGSIIPLTLIAGSGKIQDLLLEVSEEEKLPRSLIISDLRKINALSNCDSVTEPKDEAKQMLDAMIEDENPQDKYYVAQLKRKLTLPSLPMLFIIQDKSWRFKNLTGARLVITNKGKVAINLQEKHISSIFKGAKFVTIETKLLNEGASTKSWIVTEEEE